MEEMLIGVTDRTIPVFIPDPASTTGQGKTGLAAAAMEVFFTRYETDNDVVRTDATGSLNDLASLTAAHNDWGWFEVGGGEYRLDLADALFASGAWYATVLVRIASGTAAATPKAFRLVAVNALDGVRHGLTALPNAAADAAGGLIISDAGGLDADAQLVTKINDILTDTGTTLDARIPAALVSGRMDASVGAMAANVLTATAINADAITAAKLHADVGEEIADAVWDEAIAGHVGAGSTGEALTAAGAAGDPWSTAVPGAYGAGTAGSRIGRIPDIAAGGAGGLFIAGSNAATTVNFTGNITGNVSGSVGSVTGNVGGNVTGSVGSVAAGGIAAASFAAGAIDASAIAANAIGASELAADACTEIADALLNRDMSAVTVTNTRSPINALRALRNKWSIAAGTYTVTAEDDSTTAWSSAISTDAAAIPVIGSDPA